MTTNTIILAPNESTGRQALLEALPFSDGCPPFFGELPPSYIRDLPPRQVIVVSKREDGPGVSVRIEATDDNGETMVGSLALPFSRDESLEWVRIHLLRPSSRKRLESRFGFQIEAV